MSNIKETIRQEIERRKEANKRQYLSSNGGMSWQRMCGKEDCLVELLSFIDSLPEEKPSEDLEIEIEMQWDSFNKHLAEYGEESEEVVWLNWNNFNEVVKDAFIAGAEWQKRQVK